MANHPRRQYYPANHTDKNITELVRESERMIKTTISKRNGGLSSEEFYFATVEENYIAIDQKLHTRA